MEKVLFWAVMLVWLYMVGHLALACFVAARIEKGPPPEMKAIMESYGKGDNIVLWHHDAQVFFTPVGGMKIRVYPRVWAGVALAIGSVLVLVGAVAVIHVPTARQKVAPFPTTEPNPNEPSSSEKGRFFPERTPKESQGWTDEIAEAQKKATYLVAGKPHPRIKYGDEKGWKEAAEAGECHDCGITKGQLHVPGCDVEECPACHGQRLMCECKGE